ncbi:MAG: hypothetical protein KBT28_02655 [Bacteroidales bacterium]|nr:hypothetical protein [Candidatus Colimorpha merdihippi]
MLNSGNGFYFCAVSPGDWRLLMFEVTARGDNYNIVRFRKTMNANASIHVERAGFTTLTLNCTENDRIQ